MNCPDCQPHETHAVTVCGRCGAGPSAEQVVESDEHLTVAMPIRVPVPASPPARKLRYARCAAAAHAPQERRTA